MRRLVSLAVVLLSFACLAADRLPLVNPQPSLLHATEIKEKDGPFAKFAGQVRVEGTLYLRWHGAARKSAEYTLIPSVAASRRLPHFRGYRVTWIEPADGPATLRSAVDDATYERVLANKSTFHVTGSWWITEYEVGVECDAPYARARIRAAKVPDPNIASVEPPQTC